MRHWPLSNLALVLFFCFATCEPLLAHEGDEHNPELSALMKKQGKAFSKVQKGIKKQKWEGLKGWAQVIVDSADLIAKDYEPPIKKDQTEDFKSLARQLKKRARALRVGLANQNPLESMQLLDRMEDTCVACHKAFIPKKK